MEIMCGACKLPVTIPDLEQPKIINLPGTSVLILEHSEQTLCPKCLVPITAGIAMAQLALVGFPVPPKQQKNLIVVPNGMIQH
jgi:hypothetical protein